MSISSFLFIIAFHMTLFDNLDLNKVAFEFVNQQQLQMNQSNQNTKKPKPKNQPKIHRRKNEQIPKQFFCPVESCGKAYGSYAALYTHMKNKHNEVKPPNMPTTTTKPKNSHPGRPKIKKNENDKGEDNEAVDMNADQVQCKICLQDECECVESFDSDEKKKTIEIMSCEKFTSFTNQVGILSNEDVNWVRRTEDEFVFKSPETILAEIQNFNQNHNLQSNPSQKLIEYLSFASKYWDPESIDQLYTIIYAMIAFQNHQSCVKFVNEGPFPKMQNCLKRSPNEFKKLDSIVRII